MDLRAIYNFEELTNEAERLVIEELGKQLEAIGDPTLIENEDLILDIAAYSLNHVPPMYRANLLGRVYADTLHKRYGQDISAAVEQAIRKITASG
jgi:competence protein ComFB